MNDKEKGAFIIYHDQEALLFSNSLNRRGIENKISNYLGSKVVYVQEENYLESIEKGNLIAKEEQSIYIDWLNAYGEKRPIGYVPLMYCILPERRRGDITWESFNVSGNKCPKDIKAYLETIQNIFERDVKIVYNCSDNALEVLMEGDFSEQKQLVSKGEIFNKFVINNPFTKTLYLEKDGKVIQTEETKKIDKSGLNSYLYHSLFFEGLAYPEGTNISPKIDDSNDTKITGFKTDRSSYGLRKFDIISSVDDKDSKNITGNFVATIEKRYNHYWDADEKIGTNMSEAETFVMLDNGNFNTQIIVESPTDIRVDTKMEVVRNVSGYNYDQKTVRDMYFGNKAHDDSRFDLEIREYFKMIKPNKLLHYSDNSDFFETYYLPNGWKLTDGIEKLGTPRVYDDINSYGQRLETDFLIIRNLMDSRTKKDDTKTLNL